MGVAASHHIPIRGGPKPGYAGLEKFAEAQRRRPTMRLTTITSATARACTNRSTAAASKGWKRLSNVADAAATAKPATVAVKAGRSEKASRSMAKIRSENG